MGMVLDSVAMSLGGYVTGPGGDMSWLTPHLGPNPEMEDLRRDNGGGLEQDGGERGHAVNLHAGSGADRLRPGTGRLSTICATP